MADEKFRRSYLGKLRGGDFWRSEQQLCRSKRFPEEWKKTKESGGAGRIAPNSGRK